MKRSIIIVAVIILIASTVVTALADDIASALVVFSEAGDLDKVRYLVQGKGAKANSRDMFGRVALIEAAGGGHLPVVKFLVEHGATVDIRGSMGYTPLMKAIDAGHLEVVKYLGSKGADLALRDSFGNRPLDLAEKGPSPAVYKYLRPIYARFALTEDLLQSAGKGNLGEVKQIISAGLSVNTKSGDGFTPLIAAAGYGKLNVIKWLISNDADPNVVANNGVTALYVAVKYRYRNVVEYLLAKGAQLRPNNQAHSVISLAMTAGDQKILKLVLEKEQKDFNEKRLNSARRKIAETLGTYRSIKCGMLTADETQMVINCVAELLSVKADWIKQLGDDGFDVINPDLLLGGGWRLSSEEENDRKGFKFNPLMMACQFGRPKDISNLVSDGANVNERNGIGETALIVLSQTTFFDNSKERIDAFTSCADALLAAKADINATDIAGWTALMWAAYNGNKVLVKLLMDNGADTNIVSTSGATALSIAQSLGYENTSAIIKGTSR